MPDPLNKCVGALKDLASLYGVHTSYLDTGERSHSASPEALLAVLSALGAPVLNPDDATDAIQDFKRRAWNRCVEPVLVAWDGEPLTVVLRMPETAARSDVVCSMCVEGPDGVEQHSFTKSLADIPPHAHERLGGLSYLAKRMVLPGALPFGYHDLSVEFAGINGNSLLVSAPRKAPAPEKAQRSWGVFAPLHAIHSQRSWGVGDFADLAALAEWVGQLGGRVLGTLPFLAAFLDEQVDFSPYAPASRLFWNELFVDLEGIRELADCSSARRLIESADVVAERQALRQADLVDYRRQMALKRRVLFELSRFVAGQDSVRSAALRRYVQERPHVLDYARFRAVGERRRTAWQDWPEGLRNGNIQPGDFDPEVEQYHIYVQRVADEQVAALRRRAEAVGVGLHLDLPIGVHPSSYDVYRERDMFVPGASVGAPPDTFSSRGQVWGFPPPHPHHLREQRYRYFIAVLRHHLANARILRIDHVMSLHRLFFVPSGMQPSSGLYVGYPADELYAILCLEAWCAGSFIVGEDLGTVCESTRSEMTQHNLSRTYVLQFEIRPKSRPGLSEVPQKCLASLNTHDLPTFAGFWKGLDIQRRLDDGFLDLQSAAAEQRQRAAHKRALLRYFRKDGWLRGKPTPENLLGACLRYLAASRAWFALVNMEDLWLENQSQNVPGTTHQRPNWQRKMKYSVEKLRAMPQVIDVLRTVNRLRTTARRSFQFH